MLLRKEGGRPGRGQLSSQAVGAAGMWCYSRGETPRQTALHHTLQWSGWRLNSEMEIIIVSGNYTNKHIKFLFLPDLNIQKGIAEYFTHQAKRHHIVWHRNISSLDFLASKGFGFASQLELELLTPSYLSLDPDQHLRGQPGEAPWLLSALRMSLGTKTSHSCLGIPDHKTNYKCSMLNHQGNC